MDRFNEPLRMSSTRSLRPARVCTSSLVTQAQWPEMGVPAAVPLAVGSCRDYYTPFASAFRAHHLPKSPFCQAGAWCAGQCCVSVRVRTDGAAVMCVHAYAA